MIGFGKQCLRLALPAASGPATDRAFGTRCAAPVGGRPGSLSGWLAYPRGRLAPFIALALLIPAAQAGTLYVGDDSLNEIVSFDASGNRSVFASGLHIPTGLAFDSAGNLYEVDSAYPSFGQGAVNRFTPNGIETVFATGLFDPQGIAINALGDIFVSDDGSTVPGAGGAVYEYTPDGKRTTFATGFAATGLAFDASGDLFIGDLGYEQDGLAGRIWEYAPDGSRSLFAHGLGYPLFLAFNSSGMLFVGQGDILEFTPSGAEIGTLPGGDFLSFDENGYLYASDHVNSRIYRIAPDDSLTTFASEAFPSGLAFAQGPGFSPTPEPATGTLIGLAAGWFLVRRRYVPSARSR